MLRVLLCCVRLCVFFLEIRKLWKSSFTFHIILLLYILFLFFPGWLYRICFFFSPPGHILRYKKTKRGVFPEGHYYVVRFFLRAIKNSDNPLILNRNWDIQRTVRIRHYFRRVKPTHNIIAGSAGLQNQNSWPNGSDGYAVYQKWVSGRQSHRTLRERKPWYFQMRQVGKSRITASLPHGKSTATSLRDPGRRAPGRRHRPNPD